MTLKYNLGIQIFIILPWKELESIVKKKKTKDITKEKKKNIKHFLKVKQVFSLLKNLHVRN